MPNDGAPPLAARTVGELRARADAIAGRRQQLAAERLAAEQRRLAEEAEKVLQARRLALARRGEGVWREIEAEIERRNASAYDKAAGLLGDLQAIAEERGATQDFRRRLQAIRERHAQKGKLIERPRALG